MSDRAAEAFAEATRVAPAFGVEPQSLVMVRLGVNAVLRGRHPEAGTVYLRLTDPGWRGHATLAGETDWLRLLAGAGLRVPRPLAGAGGERVVAVPGAGTLATLFTEVAGHQPREVTLQEWTGGFGRSVGRLVGEVHAATTAALGTRGAVPPARPGWTDDFGRICGSLAGYDPQVADRGRALVAQAAAVPAERHLIHDDVYAENLLLDGPSPDSPLGLVDFDQACYGFFALELVAPLYPHVFFPGYALAGAGPDSAGAFLGALLAGIAEQVPLPADTEQLLPTALLLKELQVYSLLAAHPADWATALGLAPDVLASAVAAMRRRILAGTPVWSP